MFKLYYQYMFLIFKNIHIINLNVYPSKYRIAMIIQ